MVSLLRWIADGVAPTGEQAQQVAQETTANAGQALEVIETFKNVASALHMDVWWLTLVVFSFVWGLRGFLKFVKVDMKKAPRIGPFQLSPGWWPAARNWLWRIFACLFSCTVCCFAQHIAPESLPDVPGAWMVLGPTYGIGASLMYHVLDWMGVMAKLEKRGKGA